MRDSNQRGVLESGTEQIDAGRRSLFALAALPLLAIGLGARARAAEAPAAPAAPCFNPATLTAFQKSQRTAIKYRASTDPQKKCGGCIYYAKSNDSCGKCQILLNGPVAAADVCDGWSKKS